METIKIFLASSSELGRERVEIGDLVSHLNHVLQNRKIMIDLVKWEYLDASMSDIHKQQEYNRELSGCEMCLVIYYTIFGKYTKSELDTAFERKKQGDTPHRLYVYFKNGEGQPSQELKEFKDSFPDNYGNFFSDYSNIDTLKAHFFDATYRLSEKYFWR